MGSELQTDHTAPVTSRRTSLRDELAAEYEITQARRRYLSEEPDDDVEHL